MPFAGYKNFQECVEKNSDKGNPRAYCAAIAIKAGEKLGRKKSHKKKK